MVDVVVKKESIPGKGFSVPCICLLPPCPSGAAVIIHGYGGNKEEQLGLAWHVAESGVAAISIDLRGHGEHALPMDERMLDDVEAAITYGRQFGKVAAIGHSLGGRLALVSSAEYAIGISPALESSYNQQLMDSMTYMRSYRVRELYPGSLYDIMEKLPVWQQDHSERAIIYASRDIHEIRVACDDLASRGAHTARIENALHSDIYTLEMTFEKVVKQLDEWF
jgi:esterase/lipase